MANHSRIRSTGELTRQVVDDCADSLYKGLVATGTWFEREGFGYELEQPRLL